MSLPWHCALLLLPGSRARRNKLISTGSRSHQLRRPSRPAQCHLGLRPNPNYAPHHYLVTTSSLSVFRAIALCCNLQRVCLREDSSIDRTRRALISSLVYSASFLSFPFFFSVFPVCHSKTSYTRGDHQSCTQTRPLNSARQSRPASFQCRRESRQPLSRPRATLISRSRVIPLASRRRLDRCQVEAGKAASLVLNYQPLSAFERKIALPNQQLPYIPRFLTSLCRDALTALFCLNKVCAAAVIQETWKKLLHITIFARPRITAQRENKFPANSREFSSSKNF